MKKNQSKKRALSKKSMNAVATPSLSPRNVGAVPFKECGRKRSASNFEFTPRSSPKVTDVTEITPEIVKDKSPLQMEKEKEERERAKDEKRREESLKSLGRGGKGRIRRASLGAERERLRDGEGEEEDREKEKPIEGWEG